MNLLFRRFYKGYKNVTEFNAICFTKQNIETFMMESMMEPWMII